MVATLEVIDRTVFEHIRRAVVQAGFLPDVQAYGTAAKYEEAKATLRAQLPEGYKQLIEVYGVGPPEARDEKAVNTIVIDRIGYAKGNIGGFPAQFFEKNDLGGGNYNYTKYMMPSESKTLQYTFRVVTNSVLYERLILQLLDEVFGGRGYIQTWLPDWTLEGDPIMMDLVSQLDVGAGKVMEKLHTYIVPDIWITPPKVLRSNIVPMTSVGMSLYYEYVEEANKKLDIDLASE